jgi:hypothetical protein
MTESIVEISMLREIPYRIEYKKTFITKSNICHLVFTTHLCAGVFRFDFNSLK